VTGWDWLGRGAFLLYTGQLAWEDRRSGTFRFGTILSGTLCGLLLRTACLLRSGQAPAEMLKGILFALLPGAGLILVGKITRGAVGLGDGLCFMSFGFWWEGEQVFSLLFLSLCLLGCTGLFLICFRNGKRDLKLPFGPFILAGGVLETALGLLMRS
jgi:leader peptidase (prepilin peptidase)/N-methyltransferase